MEFGGPKTEPRACDPGGEVLRENAGEVKGLSLSSSVQADQVDSNIACRAGINIRAGQHAVGLIRAEQALG